MSADLNSFVPLPRAWTEHRQTLTASAQLLYIDLLLAMKPSTGVVRAGVRQIAERARLAPSTTSVALTELVNAGLIRRITEGRNQNLTSVYEVTFRRGGVLPTEHPVFDEQHSSRTARDTTPNTGRTARGVSPAETSPLDLSLDVSRPSQEGNEMSVLFDEFWNTYPRSSNRQRTEAAFNEALSVTDSRTLLAGLERYMRSDEVARGYIKNSYHWLEDEGWRNEYPAPRREPVTDLLKGVF